MLQHNSHNLYADEAQYWTWSKELAFGYYSKPPMIAWLIAATTYIFGDSEFGVRIASPVLHFFIAINVGFITKELSTKPIAFLAAATYISLPAVTLSSSLITTDCLLLFCWSLCLLFFIKALRSNKLYWWLLAGISAGFGLLSKYNMGLFIISVTLYLLLDKRYKLMKQHGFCCCLGLAALIYSPNLWWNVENNFVSYTHTGEITQLNKKLIHPLKLIEFLVSQILMFGPLLSWVTIKSCFNIKNLMSDSNFKLLACFSLPSLLLISLLSLISNAYGNWAAPIYIALTIWVSIYAYKHYLKVFVCSHILHLSIIVLFYNYDLAEKFLKQNLNITLPNPYQRLIGWQELGAELTKVKADFPNIQVICDDRKLLAEMRYYSLKDILKWNPNHNINDHYDLTSSVGAKEIGQDLILISLHLKISELKSYFTDISTIKNVEIKLPNKENSYKIYYLKKFKGY